MLAKLFISTEILKKLKNMNKIKKYKKNQIEIKKNNIWNDK
jgi:hypothetical protein